MAAKFLVTVPPGAPIPGVGFVRPGEIFTAPKGYVPSRTFKPLNAEAVEALKKVQASMLERAKGLRVDKDKTEEELRIDRKNAARLEADAKEIDLKVYEVPVEEPAIQQGVPLSELAKKDGAGRASAGAEAGGDRKL